MEEFSLKGLFVGACRCLGSITWRFRADGAMELMENTSTPCLDQLSLDLLWDIGQNLQMVMKGNR